MTKYLALLLKIALSAGLASYVFLKIDFSSAWTTLRSIPAGALLGAIALLLAQLGLSAFRLKELLVQQGQRFKISAAFDACCIGAFFSQTFVSFVGGDAMRIWRLVRFQIPGPIATKGVLLDRISGFGGMVVVVLLTIPFLVPMLKSVEMELGLLLIAASVLAGILSVFLLRRLPLRLTQGRIVGSIYRFASLGLDIVRSGRGAVHVLGLSILVQIANVLVLYILARGLSMDLSLLNCFIFIPTVLFLSMLPISVAGWGIREGAMVAALAVVGIPSHQSLALSICFGLCLVFVSLPGGAIWFLSRGRVLRAAGRAQ